MEKLNIATYLRPSTTPTEFSPLSNSIILSLLYFDIFSYPLTAREIFQHSTIPNITETTLEAELEKLIQKKLIGTDRGFFFIPSKQNLVDRRLAGNIKAHEYVQKARRISRFISFFPFVRGIFLSGSVSKGYADHNSDIDYFIVTEPGRLWLSRTLLILFKKIFLLNSRKYFCLNYFVDKEHLEIQDKNLFTAVELAYLLPVYNESIHQSIIHENRWICYYLPNFKKNPFTLIEEQRSIVKNIFEKLFSGKIGNKLDDFCLLLTERFWNYKFRNVQVLKENGIRCKKHVSKFHPQNFQHKVLDAYEKKIIEYTTLYAVNLHS